jgi:hypothetical protein
VSSSLAGVVETLLNAELLQFAPHYREPALQGSDDLIADFSSRHYMNCRVKLLKIVPSLDAPAPEI